MIEEYNALRGYNFVFNPWPGTQQPWSQPKTYTVRINLGAMQSHEYAPYGSGKSTRWTALQLVMPSDQPTNSFLPFDLDEGMFAAPIRFGVAGLLDHATEVVYSNEFKVQLQHKHAYRAHLVLHF